MLNIKTNRLEELLGTITEARKSLQDWNDKRTEALIQIDALSYDLKQIQDERTQTAELVSALKTEIEDRSKEFQKQIESITDQMQILKLEKEASDTQANGMIEQLKKQVVESELKLKRQQERESAVNLAWEKRLADQRAEVELRVAEGMTGEINTLLAQIEMLKSQVAESEVRRDRNERELQVIRAQVRSVLSLSEAENPSTNEIVKSARVARVSSDEPKRPVEFAPAGGVAAEMNEESTVQDYLKRLGY